MEPIKNGEDLRTIRAKINRVIERANEFDTDAIQQVLAGKADAAAVAEALAGKANASDIPTVPEFWPWSHLTGVPTAFAPSHHSHVVADISDFPTTWAWANIADKPALFSGAYDDLSGKPSLFDGTWSSLTGKPASFTPSAHSHTKADISDFPASWAWNALTGVPATFAPSAHSHDASDINTGTLALARLPVATSGTSSATQLVRADDTRLSNARTPTAHTHTRSQITDFPTTWAWASLSGVPATFPPSSHTHTLDDLSDVSTAGAVTGDILSFNGSSWVPAASQSAIYQSAGAIVVNGNGSEVTALTVTIPAGVMGLNGRIRIGALWSFPNDGARTLKTKFGGIVYQNATVKTLRKVFDEIEICNRGEANSQIGYCIAGTRAAGVVTSTVQTANAVNIVLSITMASGLSATLESCIVELVTAK